MIYPWQVTKTEDEKQTSNAGERMQKIYEVQRDKHTNEPKLVSRETYDQQMLIDSYAEEAEPVTLFQRVKIGEIAPWNGENCYDMSQMPESPIELAEYIADKTNIDTENIIEKMKKAQNITDPVKEPITPMPANPPEPTEPKGDK